MTGPNEVETGIFGALPAAALRVRHGLPEEFTDRFARFVELSCARRPLTLPAEKAPVWRFATRSGVFAARPVAGVWRVGRTWRGALWPLVVARLGPLPAPGDPWFDAADALLAEALRPAPALAPTLAALARLPAPATTGWEPPGAALLWRDDWEVEELAFASARDLAAHGLPADPMEAEA